jgi:hypothetical protein
MFFPGSRYANLSPYQISLPDGTVVQVIRTPLPGPTAVLGYHRRMQGQRLDHFAARYLADATAFWRLCDANGAVVPDALAARDLIGIPINAPVNT